MTDIPKSDSPIEDWINSISNQAPPEMKELMELLRNKDVNKNRIIPLPPKGRMSFPGSIDKHWICTSSTQDVEDAIRMSVISGLPIGSTGDEIIKKLEEDGRLKEAQTIREWEQRYNEKWVFKRTIHDMYKDTDYIPEGVCGNCGEDRYVISGDKYELNEKCTRCGQDKNGGRRLRKSKSSTVD